MTSRRFTAFVLTFTLLLLALIPAQAQTSFTLALPNEKTLKRDLVVDLPSFNWTPLAAATEYQLQVFHISGNARFGTTLDITVPTSNCTATNCAYIVTALDRLLFEKGEYAWTVEAATSGGTVEASNGPRYFSYSSEAVEFILNGGFETGKTTPWVAANLTADRVLVDAGQAYSGVNSWFFKGSTSENSSLSQLYDVTYYNIQAADVVTLSFAYKSSGPLLNGLVRVNVKYTDGTGKKEQKLLPAVADYVEVIEVIELTKPVKSLKVTLLNKSLKNTGKIYIDDVSLMLSGTAIRAAALPFPAK